MSTKLSKDKAKQLIDKFLNQAIDFPYIDTVDGRCIGSGYMTYKSAIQCALISVDEIIDNELLSPQLKRHYILKIPPTPQELEYWQEVKNELLKIKDNTNGK